MTTWTDEATIKTSWAETTVGFQVISLLNNTFNINYPSVNINGQQINYWEEESAVETAWKDAL